LYTLRLGHLYPDLMNLYGDRGNVIALERRCRWRGIRLEIVPLGLGDELDPEAFDLLFMGGGQDREQRAIFRDLHKRKGDALREAVRRGVVVLAICGAFQLLGHYYRTHQGDTIPGLGIFDAWTEAGPRRMIGNVVARMAIADLNFTLVGFENHSGRTYLGPGCRPLARVLAGYGNNGEDGTEGAVYENAVGTYLHGSLLPKNPQLADYLLGKALSRRYPGARLSPLDDRLEQLAHRVMVQRCMSDGRARSWSR